jgi:hypothetical protein
VVATRLREKPEPEPERPSPSVIPTRSDPPAEEEGRDVVLPIGIPAVEIESVRWHPDPSRRVARLQIEQAGPLDVREGDIIAGVLIQTIRPAEVEVRVGARIGVIPVRP